MNKELIQSMHRTLDAMEVEPSVQHFANEWISTNVITNSADIFDLLDRLMIPYGVYSANDKLHKHEHIVAIKFSGDEAITCKYTLDGYFEYDGEQFIETKKNNQISDLVILIYGPPLEKNDPDWLANKLKRFKPIIPKILLISLIANIFALAIPFITMSVYDHVIGGDAGHEVIGIAVGAFLLFSMMMLLKVIRSQLLTTIANRISREVSESIMQKLLFTSLMQNRQASTSMLINRLSTAESLKGIVQGPLGGALFDLPFVIIFIIAIGILGGWLVIVPIISLLLYFVLAQRSQKQRSIMNNQQTISGTSRSTLLVELNSKLNYLRSSQVLPFWMNRFDKASTLASKSSFNQLGHQAKYTSIYYAIGLLSTLAVIGLGVDLIFIQSLTPGGLIATMMLISRVTSPAQMMCNSYARLHQTKQAKAQINQSINQKGEGSFSFQHHHLPPAAPSLELDQVTLRFPNQLKPALSGISFSVEPGQVVAVTGPMSSGKTTLLEVIANLVSPQSGVVKVNGRNLTQYDPQLLRKWLGYYSDLPEMLPISIRDFVADNRAVNDDAIIAAFEVIGGKQWLECLDSGIDTRLDEIESMSHPLSNFEASILTQAKLLCQPYPLALLDSPSSSMKDQKGFIQWVESCRGTSTIIFTSHDAELIKIADQVVVLDSGSVSYAGPLPDKSPTDTVEEQ
ncbi:ABC transporter ATP-binding protein [Vibrio inusitatus NBRC 102082]|uniref:ABC transporter ATP-binding protein n=1 Tax=Vibrio inusitatus NBRC 102082 TaxID=1219070 RepID=A0A4Y3I0A3_9VIBR|nr:ABC transporter transmembrane domain-containing protein [Vibrio inusitatus]GEA52846.1 ABC transporter ATP-binding protein [Vibrio inusitatus NBRC 102082]